MRVGYWFDIIITPLVLALLVGCSGTQRPPCNIPEEGNLIVEATERLNPDEKGRSLPTIIRIYQLKNLGDIELASFQKMWREAEDTLGESLIAADEFTVYPGQTIKRTFERDPAASYLVGVAIVRRPAGVSWRTILDLPAPAAAQRCAALQDDPEEEPPLPEVSVIQMRVDMYTIEGAIGTQPAGCEASDLECLQNRVDGLEMPEEPEVETPETPSTPSMPSTPGMPKGDSDKTGLTAGSDRIW